MFEVGKKYEWDGRIIRVIFLTQKSVVVSYEALPTPSTIIKVGDELIWKLDNDYSHWKEYHEPVVVKDTVFVHFDEGYHGVVPSLSGYAAGGAPVVGHIEVTITDGKLTDVKIIQN